MDLTYRIGKKKNVIVHYNKTKSFIRIICLFGKKLFFFFITGANYFITSHDVYFCTACGRHGATSV